MTPRGPQAIESTQHKPSHLRRQAEGVADPKGNPIPHPAIAIERVAQDEIRKWGKTFKPRRR